MSRGGAGECHDGSLGQDLDTTPGDDQAESAFAKATPGALTECYELRQVLGRGGFGVVAKAMSRKTGKTFAVKSIPLLRTVGANCSIAELDIVSDLRHPHIVRFYEAFCDWKDRCRSHVHLVFELLSGGSLWHKIKHFWDDIDAALGFTGDKGLPADLVATYVWQILDGVAYLHSLGIAHRDVKAENCMLVSQRDGAPLKLIDFGSACRYSRGVPMTQRAGSLPYVAPEVLTGRYNEKCDVWSAGVVAFLACAGMHLPKALRALVREMLTPDPRGRPAAGHLLAHDARLLGSRGGRRACSCAAC